MTASNRRQHDRVRAQGVAAHLQTPEGLAFCVVDNIAVGGLFLRTQQLLPLGTEVALRLARPGLKQAIKLDAKVVNVVEPSVASQLSLSTGMGLSFQRLRPEDAVRLKELIRELEKNPPAESPSRGFRDARREHSETRKAWPQQHETEGVARLHIAMTHTPPPSSNERLKELEAQVEALMRENSLLRKALKDRDAHQARAAR